MALTKVQAEEFVRMVADHLPGPYMPPTAGRDAPAQDVSKAMREIASRVRIYTPDQHRRFLELRDAADEGDVPVLLAAALAIADVG